MRPKPQHFGHTKHIVTGIIVIFFLFFIFRSTFSSSNNKVSYAIPQTIIPKVVSDSFRNIQKVAKCSPTCTKIPPSLAQALVHYTTSTITPQQTIKEISITKKVLDKKSPCNFLVFGLGHDSLMWSSLNFNGRTVFLEEDEAWIEKIKKRFSLLESYHVTYDSKVNQADSLMEAGKGSECTTVGELRHSACQLALKGLPSDVYETTWDLIMVDAPTGYYDEAPGRMSAIYTAGMMARNREEGKTDVFVHDVNRIVEDKFSNAFLCEGYMVRQEGRLRHFRIPGHRDDPNKPFCPKCPIPTII